MKLSPLTSGAGRLFQAVASLLGLGDHNSFEGEGAMALEAAAGGVEGAPYPFEIAAGTPSVIDFSPALRDLLHGIDDQCAIAFFNRRQTARERF